jgi:hypothetical protein
LNRRRTPDILGQVEKRGSNFLCFRDVDPTCTREEFLESYTNDPAKHEKLIAAKRAIAENGWTFPALD